MRPITYDVQDALQEFVTEGLTSTEAALLCSCSENQASAALSCMYSGGCATREQLRSAKGRPLYRYWPVEGRLMKQGHRRSTVGYTRAFHSRESVEPSPALVAPTPPLSAEFLAWWSPLPYPSFGATV